jgi:hypothetical protein
MFGSSLADSYQIEISVRVGFSVSPPYIARDPTQTASSRISKTDLIQSKRFVYHLDFRSNHIARICSAHRFKTETLEEQGPTEGGPTEDEARPRGRFCIDQGHLQRDSNVRAAPYRDLTHERTHQGAAVGPSWNLIRANELGRSGTCRQPPTGRPQPTETERRLALAWRHKHST